MDGTDGQDTVDVIDPGSDLDPGVEPAVDAGGDAAHESAPTEGGPTRVRNGADQPGAPEEAGDGHSPQPSRKGVKVAVTALAALAVAGVVVMGANAMGGSGEVSVLPATVSSPSVVLEHLQSQGWSCPSVAVVDQVATCSSTVTVRVFTDADTADAWVSDVLKAASTSSAVGWVVHGNTVVAGPLTSTPTLADLMGPGSRIF
ncbi:MAG: hypothetical protein WAN48_09910 [Actinomycetes bacterium]